MKVSIDSVINDAKFKLGLRNTTMPDLDLERLVNEGALHINAVDSYVILCETLEVECGRACLPEGFVELICMSLPDGGSSCSGCCNINFNPVVDQNPTSIVCACPQYWAISRDVLTAFCGEGGSCSMNGNLFDVQNGYLVFSSAFTGSSVKIWYRSYNMDADGIMVLDESWQRGLSSYAAYNYAMAGQNYRNYSPQQISDWKREWVAQVNKIRGRSAQKDHRQHKGIFSAIARAILINPGTALNRNI